MKLKKLLLILLALPLLASCGTDEDSSSVDPNVEAFNTAIEHDYSSFKISITTSKGDLKLESIYSVSKENESYKVEYTKEKYNTFDLSSDSNPTSMITTETGSYVTDKVEYDISRFSFNEESFETYSFKEGVLEGKVKNGKEYLNANYDCLNLSAKFEYSTLLTKIELSYTLSDSSSIKVIIEDFK